jgi:hypothetical protein
MNHADELMHLIMQGARQTIGDVRVAVTGHVTSYDPTTHAVKVAIPTFRLAQGVGPASEATVTNADGTGDVIISPWIPLGTPWAAKGAGMQVAPHPGTTPTAGDQAMIVIEEREAGMSCVACLTFNDINQPPDATLKAGEAVLKHDSGTLIKFFQNGDLTETAVHVFTLQQITPGQDGNPPTQGGSIVMNSIGQLIATAPTEMILQQQEPAQGGGQPTQGASIVMQEDGSLEVTAPLFLNFAQLSDDGTIGAFMVLNADQTLGAPGTITIQQGGVGQGQTASVVLDPNGNVTITVKTGSITLQTEGGAQIVLQGANVVVLPGSGGTVKVGAGSLQGVARLGDQVTVGSETGTITSASATVFAQD